MKERERERESGSGKGREKERGAPMVIKDSFKSFFPITSILSFRSFSVMRAPKVKSKVKEKFNVT